MFAMACTEFFDISSSVFVLDADGVAVTDQEATFCQALTSTELTEKGDRIIVRACTEQSIHDGVATIPNWEGQYRGDIVDFQLWLKDGDSLYPGELIDSDEDVWCDNVDVDTDANGNTTSTPFCTSNFEFFFVWQVVINH